MTSNFRTRIYKQMEYVVLGEGAVELAPHVHDRAIEATEAIIKAFEELIESKWFTGGILDSDGKPSEFQKGHNHVLRELRQALRSEK